MGGGERERSMRRYHSYMQALSVNYDRPYQYVVTPQGALPDSSKDDVCNYVGSSDGIKDHLHYGVSVSYTHTTLPTIYTV